MNYKSKIHRTIAGSRPAAIERNAVVKCHRQVTGAECGCVRMLIKRSVEVELHAYVPSLVAEYSCLHIPSELPHRVNEDGVKRELVPQPRIEP